MASTKTLSFFGEEGITSTSANHIANLAKELIRSVQEKLANVRFTTESISLISSETKTTVSQGISEETLENIHSLIKNVGEVNSLIAYLREAIKEKERKIKEAQNYSDYNTPERIAINRELAALKSSMPQKEIYPTIEDLKQKWSVGQQEKYLSLEAQASAIGKFIHEDGFMSRARIGLMQKMQNPSRVDLNGSETIIHTFTPTVSLESVDKVFNALQAKHRSIQAELNGMKKLLDDALMEEKIRIDTEYAGRQREYDTRLKELTVKMHRLDEKETADRNELIRKATSLKIVIPNRLKDIYETVKSL